MNLDDQLYDVTCFGDTHRVLKTPRQMREEQERARKELAESTHAHRCVDCRDEWVFCRLKNCDKRGPIMARCPQCSAKEAERYDYDW